MSVYCEDYPCCGHELGCCPPTDPETGQPTAMVCTCGALVPLGSRFSICQGCLDRPDPNDPDPYGRDPLEDEDPETDEYTGGIY